jgi:hypothetical protein
MYTDIDIGLCFTPAYVFTHTNQQTYIDIDTHICFMYINISFMLSHTQICIYIHTHMCFLFYPCCTTALLVFVNASALLYSCCTHTFTYVYICVCVCVCVWCVCVYIYRYIYNPCLSCCVCVYIYMLYSCFTPALPIICIIYIT